MSKGSLINEIPCFFEIRPQLDFEAQSYCTLAKIPNQNVKDIMQQMPKVKQSIIKKVLDNPFDLDRNYFTLQLRTKVPYFKNCSINHLKKIYYNCEHQYYEFDQIVFNSGEKCEFLYFVIRGVVCV